MIYGRGYFTVDANVGDNFCPPCKVTAGVEEDANFVNCFSPLLLQTNPSSDHDDDDDDNDDASHTTVHIIFPKYHNLIFVTDNCFLMIVMIMIIDQ